jgi:hypothetical protein
MVRDPLQERTVVTTLHWVPRWWRRFAGRAAVGATVLLVLSACDLPFDLGLPTTRALEAGAADSLDAASSIKITGSFTDSGGRQNFNLELVRPSTKHVLLSGASVDLEAIIIGPIAYFRGQEFLSSHMGSDPLSRSRVLAAGNSWWKGSASDAPQLPDFTEGSSLRSTFLGPAVTSRSDHQSIGGVAAIELSGPRADVFIAEAPPYRLLRLHIKNGVVIDGIVGADVLYSDFDTNFGITAPRGAIDFTNLSTLPPIYTVVSVDTSACGTTCVVSSLLKNLGGKQSARAPSTVTFTITDPATKQVIGTCTTEVKPDVGYNATTKASCTISGVSGFDHNAAVVTATADNPGRA